MRSRASLIVLAIVGCSSPAPSDASVPRDTPPDAACPSETPSTEAPYTVTFAGAPVSLFGDAASPRFEEVFDGLAAAGADAFYPWFGIVDTGGTATVAPHFLYFLPRSWTGSELACEVVSPYAAAEGRLDLVFPALLFADGEGSTPFDEAVFRERYDSVASSCWVGHEARVVSHQVFDEVAWVHALDARAGVASRPLEDVARAVTILHELDDRPTLLVEAPAPLFFEADTTLAAAERERLTALFWSAVDATAPHVDRYGFDVYPVPYFAVREVGDYVQVAAERAPSAEHVAVLQAFSYGAESGHVLDARGPTAAEARFMAFDAVLAGATQIVWYGASALDLAREDDAAVWESALAATRLLAEVGPWLGGEDVPLSAGTDVRVLARRTGSDGPLTLVVLNRSELPTEATLTLPRAYGRVHRRDGAAPSVEGTTVRVALSAWDVAVLRAEDCR